MSKKGKQSKRNLIEQELDDATDVIELEDDEGILRAFPYLMQHTGSERSKEKIHNKPRRKKVMIVKMPDDYVK